MTPPPAAEAPEPAVDPRYDIARDAYLYAYSIVTMEATRRQATHVPDATTVAMRAPVNQFAHFRTYPDANARDVVRFNFDTLYSFAWLDLEPEPIVLSVPDTAGRYYLIPLLDMWTEVFAVVGARTTGTASGHYAIMAPGWLGEIPPGVTRITAPTASVWVMGRTQTNGPADYDNVHALQDGYRLTPLSAWGSDYSPPGSVPVDPSVDDQSSPVELVNALDGVAMLSQLADVLQRYPPHPNDYPILFRLRQLGLDAGQPFDMAGLEPQLAATINTAAKDALQDVQASLKTGFGVHVNGWIYTTNGIGTYGTAYKNRAIVTLGGLGANLPEDAVYPTTFAGVDGQPYNGANRYVLHFEAGQLPPAEAFWSITLYDDESFQVPNALNRFALGDRDPLVFNADGSLDIVVQHDSPGADKEPNWLPAPAGVFNLTMRIYSPRREVLDGTWSPPPVQKLT